MASLIVDMKIEKKIDDAVKALQDGRMVILVDDEDRENEGDLMIAAEKVTKEAINFMAKHGRGLICLALTPEKCKELELSPMVLDNRSKFNTAFTVSIEAREGVTTGISANDRATTIKAAIRDGALPSDLVRPGHIFPLMAKAGGVLSRTGQTEGAVDLARIAGFKPYGVICEIMNEDGEMARMNDLKKFSKKFSMPIISIADVIEYRLKKETFVTKIGEGRIESALAGKLKVLVYLDKLTNEKHVAFIRGNPARDDSILVRVHAECILGDVIHSRECDCGEQLRESLNLIGREKSGVLLYMRQGSNLESMLNKLKSYSIIEGGGKIASFHDWKGKDTALKDYGVGAQILSCLGLKRIRLITNSPKKIIALAGYGLTIVERVPILAKPSKSNILYLKNKKINKGHLIENLEVIV